MSGAEKKLEVSVVARRLAVSTDTVYRLYKRGDLAGMRAGARQGIRIFESSVNAFENRRTREVA